MLMTSWLRSVQNRLILNRRRAIRRRPERENGGQSAERLEDKTLLVAPTLVGVLPNVGEFLVADEVRDVAPQQITLQFNPGQQIDPGTLSAITVTRSVDGSFGNGDDIEVPIGFAGLGDLPEDVILRFSENLPDDQYRINIDGASDTPLRNADGEAFNDGRNESFPFELDLGAQVVSIVPQPITRRGDGTLRQDRNQIEVYFNDDDLNPAMAADPSFYDLIHTNETTTNLDDSVFNPTSVVYDPVEDKATLTFISNIHNLGGEGTYRLRIGTDEAIPQPPIETTLAVDPGDAFRTADTSVGDLAALGNHSQVLSAAIEAQPFELDFPGSHLEPGHRDIEAESHIIVGDPFGPPLGLDGFAELRADGETGADVTDGITTIFYNFQDQYGFDPNGVPLLNVITEAQKQRAREAFEIFSTTAGLDFVETDSQGLTIVTGDPRAIGSDSSSIQSWNRSVGIVIMNANVNWNDEIALPGVNGEESWFHEALSGISRLLGLGYNGELPEESVNGDESLAGNGSAPEPDFFVDGDAVHLQFRYRPDSIDIDLYEFQVSDAGLFSAEVVAERLSNASNLDSVLRLFDADGNVIAQNDDYFSEDSVVEISLEPGTYYIGVSASGNDDYDPVIAGTGIEGTSQGEYDLRLNFRPSVDDALLDTTGTAFDGDRDGVAGGVEDFWFYAARPADVLIVDKAAPNGGTGTITSPYNQIDQAFQDAQPGDVVRIVGNGGADGDISTIEDNEAYEIGFDVQSTPQPLVDGASMEVPQGVTTMIDAGALLKFHRSRIGVGSSTSSVDNSASALQILGIPGTEVLLTSWLDESVGNDTTPPPTTPSPGNWGGINFQNDVDNAQARFNYEDEGIFLNYVSHADFQYGGGNVVVNSTSQTVNPIHLTEARPTIINNTISLSADSAMSADPNSFEETNFNTPQFQTGSAFTQDYKRVGPDVYGNILVNNSTNGMFIRVETSPGSPQNRLTVAARLDDTDIVHVLTGNLEVAGTPGGAVLDSTAPSVILVTVTESLTGGTLTAGDYNYRVTFVDSAGNESPASNITRSISVTGPTSTVELENLPPADPGFTSRRLYRSDPTGGGVYTLIANLDTSSSSFVDDGTTLVGTLDPVAQVQLARMNARLALDAGTILKFDQARLELGFGASLIAEGDLGREIILTSRKDDRYGIGGTFDTNNDDNDAVESQPVAGDWGGIYAGHTSSVSLDRSLVTFGGGITPLEGDFATFNVLEIHQATARVTNSVFENNADGTGGPAPVNRFGRLPNSAGTIFVRASQPIIVDNIVRDSEGPAITINANALNNDFVRDTGRSTGLAESIVTFADNQGPLVRGNVFGRNQINGMEIRGETLTTGGVWDDTDVVHVLQSEIYIPDLHTFGGLRLESSSDASLVVKLEGADAGFTANGRPLDITDRIGGALHIIGQPFRPVVLTSLADDSIGSGFGLDGLPLTDTNSDGNASTPAPGDWRSIRIDQFAHDRNVDMIVENETANELSPDTNGAITIAEFLGELGEHEKDSDENLRLGFSVSGAVSRADDVDVYSFVGSSGTEIWIDLDQTRHSFDGVVELLNANGQIIAQSDNSLDEFRGNFSVFTGVGDPNANSLAKSVHEGVDYYSTNQRDAGFRVILPGSVGSVGTFFIRVRASNIDSLDPASDRADLQDDSKLSDGLTFGGYELEVRLSEIDETPGSTVRYSDVRFATNGIEVFGHPSHSPLTGDIAEPGGADGNDTLGTAIDGGNIGNSNRGAISFAGEISTDTDVDFFEFDVTFDSTESGDPFPDLSIPVTIDLDYADGFSRANTTVSIFDENGRLVYVGRDSSISEDRPAPLNGADVDDLSRGSIGPNDAYIGPVELLTGRYFMAVTSNGQIPNVLQNTATRLEPLTTFNRISEEQFGNDIPGTAGETISDLFTTVQQPDGSITLDPSHTEFHLSDVSLFISGSGITGGATGIYTVDGFTGAVQNHVGQSGIRVDDIATRPDGELFSYANSVFQNPPNDNNLGHYAHISTADGTITDLGDDGPTTWFAPDCTNGGAQQANAGVFYNAIHYDGTADNAGLAVGNNFASSGNFFPSFYQRNALFNFNIQTGATINQEFLPRIGLAQGCDGIHTNLFEIGRVDALGENFVTGLADARDANGNPNALDGQTDVYAIDNAGVLYAVDYQLGTDVTGVPRNRNVVTTTIGQVIDRPFSGLVAGPRVGTENGLYEQLLFGVTTDGEVYVFDTSGNLRPVLAGGNHVVQTGITGADGIAFGTLDYNLWEVTDNRANDDGHGWEASPDGTREASAGGTSLYFGNQNNGRDAGNKNNSGAGAYLIQTNEQNNIDFPGGAQGDVVSNEFSLKGYGAGDKPTLYFNYFIETEDSNGADVADSIRVYVGGDETFVDTATGEMTPWSLVATNNSTRVDGEANDELDYGIGPFNTEFPDAQSFANVSLLQDVSDWRQVRVDLSGFAGEDNLRLRFVFSSAGGLNIGQVGTTNPFVFPASGGEELYSLPGSDLRDGDQFTVEGAGGPETFTFDLGYTLIAPSGAGITEGDTFTIDGTTFEFDSDGSASSGFAVAYTPIMTANELAQNVEEAINQFLAGTVLVTRNGNRVNISNAGTLTENSGLIVEGAPGGGGANRIPINSGMSRDEVAAEMRIVLADALANGQLDAIQGTRDRIVFALEQITDPGPLPAGNILPGEEFGRADSDIAGPSPRGTDNKVEGVYIDDIVIGFAERGEMATGAPVDATFTTNPDSSTDILTGVYDVEVRRAAEIGHAVNGSPSLILDRVLDTNHRFTNGTSLSFPNPGGVADGDTFSISDGNNIVIFEFDDVTSGTGVQPGHQPISFDPINSDPDHEDLARAVRDAINSPAVQGILDIVAGLEDGSNSGSDSSSCTVNLYGNAIVDLERPVAAAGVLGEINPVEALNSDDLFTFQNHSASSEQIESISLVLPEGLYFDPNPGDAASGADGASGPAVSANSGSVGEVFTFDFNDAGLRDEVRVLFSNFDAGETFEFGVDVDTSNDPEDYIGTRYTITFDSGRIVDGFFQSTQDVNPLEHDAVIDQTRRDFVAVLGNRVFLTQYDDFGDSNSLRDQGQVLIQQNSVTDSSEFGIVIDAGARNPDNIPLGGSGPHQGPVRNLQEVNTENLVHGVVVENNVVARGGTGGILFSGEAGDTAPVPHGRLINNTVVGLGAGTGILVNENAGPTILNNVVADFATGIQITPDSEATTVLGTTLYRGNTTDADTGGIGLGTFPLVLASTDVLFIDQANGNYYPAPSSRTIDASLNALGDRAELVQVKSPLGISESPIIAPDLDVFGQFRGDDPAVSPPSGLGSNIFKDRGAIDRVDFFAPQAVLANPEDNSVLDLDPDVNEVWIDEPDLFRQFIVRLDDEGIGIDDRTATSEAFMLYQDEVLLVDGVDYIFTYNSNTKEAIFTAVTTFDFERNYRIEVDNDDDLDPEDSVNGIRDLAGNYLAANQTDGTTQFFVLVTDGVNDPPENAVPVDQVLPEDTVFTFSSATGTALSVSDPDVHLGNNELRITLTATDGLLTLGSLAGLTFTAGDGVDDVTMTFTGDVDDLNTALNGTTFTPTAEFVGLATVTIRTEDQGQFSGPPPGNEEDIDVVTLEYVAVNDPPTFDLPGSPPAAIIEDAGPQTIVDFADNIDAGASNEGGQTLTFIVTVTSTTGNLEFTSAPSINPTTGDLTFETAPHTNGTALIRVELQDDGADGGDDRNTSDPQFFTLVIDAINDEPTFNFAGNTDPPPVDEDAGPQTIPGYVTNITPGPPAATDEADQNVTLTFSVVGTTGNLEFTSISIDPDTGDLTYEAAPDTAGNGLIAVRVVDDGAAAPPPNDNEGETQLFTIVVNSIDDAPVAITPDYVIDHGETLNLDGSESFDVDIPLGDSITYSWDLDNDGTFGDAVGATPSVPWTTLLGFGFTVPGEHTVQLRVTDAANSAGVSRDDIVQANVTVIAVDYGDAPDSFGTTKASEGAAHEILPGFHLGATIDSDIDGAASGNAQGDDNTGGDDEDGITFHTTIEAATGQALTSPFTVDVTASFAGKLDVWVDFNNDGTFDPDTEHANGGIAYDVFNGTQILPMTVPAGASLGTVDARFRLSTSGGLTPTGRADNGEVEDHQVTIIAVQAPVVPGFTAPGGRTIDQTPTFQWTGDPANTSYQFQLRDSDGNLVEDRQNLGVTESTVADDLPFGVYTYRVRAFNRAGTASAWTANQTLEIAPPATTITGPNGRVGDATPTFTWDEIPGVAQYQIQVDNVTTGEDNVIDVTVEELFYASGDELPLGDYRVRVRGIAGGVDGDFTADHSFKITTAPNITAPESLTFNSTPTVEWEAVEGAGSYQVRIRVDGSPDNVVNVTGITGTSYTLTEPLAFGSYRVLVRATAEADPNFKGDNDTDRFRVVLRPELLTSGQFTDPTPVIRWNAVEGGLTYEIRVHDRTRDVLNVVRVDGIAGLSYTLPRLAVGRYAVSVRSENPFGELSLWSRTRVIKIVTRPQLTGPSGSFFNQQPLFQWRERDGVQDYELRVHRLANGGDRVDNYIRLIVPAGGLTYGSPYETSEGIRLNLPRNGYQWSVRGITSDGLLTRWSTSQTFRTTGEPTLEEVGSTTDRTPQFRWSEVDDAASYIFRIRRADNNETVLQEGGITATTFTPPEALDPGEYRAWVRAVAADGTRSGWSNVNFEILASSADIDFAPAQPITVEPVIDHTLDSGVEYLAQVDMPMVAEPVADLTDPDIEIVSQHDIPLHTPAAQTPVKPVEFIPEIDGIDEVLSAEPSMDWLNGVTADDDTIDETTDNGVELRSAEIATGVLGLLGASLTKRRRRDRKSKRKTE